MRTVARRAWLLGSVCALLLACGGLVTSNDDATPAGDPARATEGPASSVPLDENSSLRVLAVDGLPLSPPFEPNQLEYTTAAFAAKDVLERLPSITAVPSSSRARVTIDGASSGRLRLGNNRVDVRVVAENGSSTTYSIRSSVTTPGKVWRFVATNAADNQQFGTAIAFGEDFLVVGKHWDHSAAAGVDGDPFAKPDRVSSGSVFVYRRDGAGGWDTTASAYLKASDPAEYAHFGARLALSGDTLVVAADKDGAATPAAFVFRLVAGKWVEEAHLRPQGAAEYVPVTVGVSGSTIALGYPGQVEVFERSGSTWSRSARLEPAPLAGCSMVPVAISGDTIAAACHAGSWGATGKLGAIVVLMRAAGTWSEQATLSSLSSVDSFFGNALALDGDTIVAGAPADGSGATGIGGDPSDVSKPFAGAAYVFRRHGTTWSNEAFIKAPYSREQLWFGSSVAVRGDMVAVGSPFDSSKASGIGGDESDMSLWKSGAVFLYARREDGTWAKHGYVKSPTPIQDAAFGTSVAIGARELASGAMFEFPAGGAAYVY